MRRSKYGVVVAVLLLAASYSYAVEVTLFGPKQYTKTAAQADFFSESFPGRSGSGKIVVQNSGIDGQLRIKTVTCPSTRYQP